MDRKLTNVRSVWKVLALVGADKYHTRDLAAGLGISVGNAIILQLTVIVATVGVALL
jgi:hypothetical protein